MSRRELYYRAGDLEQAANQYRVSQRVLRTLSELMSTLGAGVEARKLGKGSKNRAPTVEEKMWIETLVQVLTARCRERGPMMQRCMNGNLEDLRRKIVSAVERGMPKARAARTFSVSLSSVKRYAEKAGRGEPLAPRRAPAPYPSSTRRPEGFSRRIFERASLRQPPVSLRLRAEPRWDLTVASIAPLMSACDVKRCLNAVLRSSGKSFLAWTVNSAHTRHPKHHVLGPSYSIMQWYWTSD